MRPAVCESLPDEGPYYEELRIIAAYDYFEGVSFCNDSFDVDGEVPLNGGHCNVGGIAPGGSRYNLYLNYKFGVDFRSIDIEISVGNWLCPDIRESWFHDVWSSQQRFFFTGVFLDLSGLFSLTIEVTNRP